MSLRGIIARKGASITFSFTTSTRDESTGLSTSPTTTTVTGKAMQIDGDPVVYKELGLTETDNPTLIFTPDTAGQLPSLGSTTTWGADAFTLKSVRPCAMKGTATAAFLVVGR